MPLYDYKCNGCDHLFEVNHGMNDKPELACPECQGADARKVLSTGGILGSSKLGQIDGAPAPSCAPPGGCAGGVCPMG